MDATVNAIVTGSPRINAQAIVCHDPISRASNAPSEYASAAQTTAANRRRSARWNEPSPPLATATNPTTDTAPAALAHQNPLLGRSFPRTTANTAVAAGSNPITTAA